MGGKESGAGYGGRARAAGAREQQQLFRVHISTFLPSYMACCEAPPLGKWEGVNMVPEGWLELDPRPTM